VKITSPLLGTTLDLPERPARIVSLVSSATETLFALGAGDAVAGVTPYCTRYVPGLAVPVVADYVSGDAEEVRAVRPDLVVATDGVQLPLARRLAEAGLPVVLLPVPQSRFGILENTVALGALAGRLAEARALCDRIERACAELVASAPARRPRAYAELWFGRHLRRPGGRAFVHDLLWLAGLEPVHGGRPDAYAIPDLDEVPHLAPDWVIVFSEPEHPVDAQALVRERGWDGSFAPRVLASTTDLGRNLIHDGPSFVDTARWLRDATSIAR
jgi:ABC-type Fe3+-hydroxamate transport system substrate-binding protein